jgi:predicted transcriptional regulator
MMQNRVDLHIGDLEDMGDRFKAAWKAVEAGETIQRDHVTFFTLDAFMSAMSPKRLELLRHLHASGPMSVRALSKALNRDYKSVHGDAAILSDAGLIERPSKDLIAAPWDKVVSELNFSR